MIHALPSRRRPTGIMLVIGVVSAVAGRVAPAAELMATAHASIRAGDAQRHVAALADDLRVPALFGIPVGHIEQQWTIPLGAGATLDADARTLQVHRQGLIDSPPFPRSPESMP